MDVSTWSTQALLPCGRPCSPRAGGNQHTRPEVPAQSHGHGKVKTLETLPKAGSPQMSAEYCYVVSGRPRDGGQHWEVGVGGKAVLGPAALACPRPSQALPTAGERLAGTAWAAQVTGAVGLRSSGPTVTITQCPTLPLCRV